MSKSILQQFDEHVGAVQAARGDIETIEQCARLVTEAFRDRHRLYLVGNGGSAADAQHIAAEMIGRFKRSDKPPLPAVALTTDSSNLTALGNDYGFEEIFKRQVEALVQKGDVVWALSVSGISPNIIKALPIARKLGARIIGFTGLEGTQLKSLCDVCLMVQHTDSDRVQEVHQLAYHIVCGMVEDAFSR